MYLISCKKMFYTKIYEALIVNASIGLSFFVKYNYGNFSFIVDAFYLIVIPIIYLLKSNPAAKKSRIILYPFIAQGIIMIFQLNILFVRDLDSEKINNEYYLLGFVLQLDYYIFLIITWLGVTKMGLWSGWFFSKDITVLKAEKEKELAKAEPDMEKVADIEKQISEIEKSE